MSAALKTKKKTAIDPFDEFVGSRIRQARICAGESQQKLAARLGITFQQVQKYEKGVNKANHHKIYEISLFYKLPLNYFTDGYNGNPPEITDNILASDDGTFLSRGSLRIAQLYNTLEDPKLQKSILNLLGEMVTEHHGRKNGK